ncbi:MAG: type VII toxin-antitoxin system HepT family RNase toxin [Nitrospirota bacterium]
MLDRERVLAKIDELEGYLKELKAIVPTDYNEYLSSVEKRRACERLLQISVECVIDISSLFVAGLRLGLPSEEADLFERLAQNGIISAVMKETLRSMKGFRNILVHDYAGIDNAIAYEIATTRLTDFELFIKEILCALKKKK